MAEDIKSTFLGKAPPIGTLILIISMATIGGVLFTPAMTEMATYFSVRANVVEYAITIYLLGYALAQLIYGPLANRFGRKPVLVWGIASSIIFSILCGLSKPFHSLPLLMIARFFAALSSGVGLIVTLTMISDVFTPNKAARIMPITAISFAVLPGVAICAGGFITEYLSWDWCFYILAIYFFIGLVLALLLCETQEKGTEKKIVYKLVFRDYLKLICDKRLISFSAMVGLTSMFIYIYASVAPVLTIKELGLQSSEYGMLSLIPFVCYAMGNLLTSALNKLRYPMKKSIAIAYSCILLLSVVFFADVLLQDLTLWAFYVLVCFVFFFIPIIWSNASVKATSEITDKANSNAVLSFINVMGCFVGLLAVSATGFLTKEISMSLLFVLVSIVLLIIGVINYKKYPV